MFDSPLILIIGATFISGFVAQRVRLPALVGFLLAGFALQRFGIGDSEAIEHIADLGVIMLLFTIGLKMDIRQLLRREVILGGTAQTLCCALGITLLLAILSQSGMHPFDSLNHRQWWILAVALSFSSTVIAVKAMQEKGEMNSCYGRLCLATLVIQDILAIIFLSLSTGKLPEIWALGLFALPLLRPLLFRLLDLLGHDETMVLGGVFLAILPGAALFNFCGLNPELGALVMGMLLAPHPRASELSKSLFSLKELFLVCFFIQIGLAETPTWRAFFSAALLSLFLPIKGLIYYFSVRFFGFRARTSLQTALTMSNFSEFGLIVGTFSVKQGLLESQLLVVIALSTAISFLLSSPISRMADRIYQLLISWGVRDYPDRLHSEDRPIDPGDAKVLILGVGRIGTCAYDELQQRYGEIILGVEVDPEITQRHNTLGRNVINGDAADPDFWHRIIPRNNIQLILLALPQWPGTKSALQELRRLQFGGRIAAIVQFEDEMAALKMFGIDAAFNIYNEAGSGFARHVIRMLNTDHLFLTEMERMERDSSATQSHGDSTIG